MKQEHKQKVIAGSLALALIGMFVAFGVAGFATVESGSPVYTSTISDSMSNVTDTVLDLFTGILPLIVVVSLVGGLIGSLPKLFKFDF